MRGVRYLLEVIGDARRARTQCGKSVHAQLAEIVTLRRQRLGAEDYFRYRLFDDGRFTPLQKREFTGWRFQNEAYRKVNDPGLVARSGLRGGWDGMVDKLLFDALMRAAGIPVARVLAVYDPDGVVHPDATTCRSQEDFARCLRDLAPAGFFAKPARAHSGAGAVAVEAIRGDTVGLADGRWVPIADLVSALARFGRVVVQERLHPHRAVHALSGPTIATVRVAVLRGKARSVVHRTVLRIPAGKNMTDNFDGGQSGNLLGWVDPERGTVARAYLGSGLSQERVEKHPDTGARLEGFQVPDWDDAVTLVVRASRALAGMPLQSWDVAPTERGPVFLEVNDMSSQDVLQLAGPPGMLDETLCRFLRDLGLRWPYPHH